jgi:citrate synthase
MKDTLTIIDNRTGAQYEVPIAYGTDPEQSAHIRTADLRKMKATSADFGLLGYDPAFMNTASCKSAVTFIDGDAGILRYRGYDIAELAAKSSYLEVAYLVLNGELPTGDQLEVWINQVTNHTMVHENIKKFLDGFRHDAHPMGMLISAVAALSTFYPESKQVLDSANRQLQSLRLIAKMPTLAAYAYRHSVGLPFWQPDNDLSYCGNFLSMMFRMTEREYVPNPVLERALDLLFILHADHEQNCSANAMRSVGRSQADPYVATAAAAAALYGPLHGGANEQVLRMLKQIGEVKRIPEYLDRVKKGEFRLMGFGHRVYKNYDPRAKLMQQTCHEVLAELGIKDDPLLDVAMELEKVALHDEYFIEKKLYPNIDFYSGITLKAMGFPTSMFTVLFAVARTVGWIAQWKEMIEDPSQRIGRPRQLYSGATKRDYVPMSRRK